MAKPHRRDTCLYCHKPLPPPAGGGGRPRKFCSPACRWAQRRHRRTIHRPTMIKAQRQADTRVERRHMRQQAEKLTQAARQLAADARAEDQKDPYYQTGWQQGPIAGYTAAALPLVARARAVLAAAVAADRAAGGTWAEIAAVLDVSPDTAARRYRDVRRTSGK